MTCGRAQTATDLAFPAIITRSLLPSLLQAETACRCEQLTMRLYSTSAWPRKRMQRQLAALETLANVSTSPHALSDRLGPPRVFRPSCCQSHRRFDGHTISCSILDVVRGFPSTLLQQFV
eukprot:jgi/Botrbrau1/10104/Bobra.20_2s0011.1